jgi:energy-coupling factor transporter ATP-binding protein EcfA2
MYITSIEIRNIRSIANMNWQFGPKQSPGLHVILGDNGSGKSTFLRAIALALLGPEEVPALREDWGTWIRGDNRDGIVKLEIQFEQSVDKVAGKGNAARDLKHAWGVKIEKHELSAKLVPLPEKIETKRFIWSGKPGWFSAAYGPFRRFAGGDKDLEKLYDSHPRLARHLSLFGEGVALSETLSWLQNLKFKALEAEKRGDPDSHEDRLLLKKVIEFINQEDFLPHQAQIEEISSKSVKFVDGNGYQIRVEELSDGYRSILSMTFELIRQLVSVYGVRGVFGDTNQKVIQAPGVVLIDELDAHLHPTWQQRIGIWLTTYFPKIQFLVTTHSPIICQAVSTGSIFRLAAPGTKQPSGVVTGVERARLLYGTVLDAYGTEAFGANIGRSSVSREKLKRLAELNLKELKTELSKQESNEQQKLRSELPTNAYDLDS